MKQFRNSPLYFMADNCPVHRFSDTEGWKQRHNILEFLWSSWPSTIPRLKSNRKCRACLKIQVKRRLSDIHTTDRDDLKRELWWNKLLKTYVKSPYISLPKRCRKQNSVYLTNHHVRVYTYICIYCMYTKLYAHYSKLSNMICYSL